MTQYLAKLFLSAIIIVAVSEIIKLKPSSLWSGILASLPLVSVLAILWAYFETKDTQRIADFSWNVFWLVLPSLSFFALFPFLLKRGAGFAVSLSVSLGVMAVGYVAMAFVLSKFGIRV